MGVLLEGPPLLAVAHEEQADAPAPVAEDPRRVDEVDDPLVGDHAGDVAEDRLAPLEPEAGREGGVAGPRREARGIDRVRHHDHLLGRDAAGHDVGLHRLGERDDRVGGGHACCLHGSPLDVPVGRGAVAGRPRDPGLLEEAPDLVDDPQRVALAEGEGDLGVGVVRGRVEDGRPELRDESIEAGRRRGGLHVGRPGERRVRADPVVRHALHALARRRTDPALREREARPRGEVRVEPDGPLGEGDLLGPDGVAVLAVGKRVGEEVEHPAGRRRPARPGAGREAGSPRRVEDAQLGLGTRDDQVAAPVVRGSGQPAGELDGLLVAPGRQRQVGEQTLTQLPLREPVRDRKRLVQPADRRRDHRQAEERPWLGDRQAPVEEVQGILGPPHLPAEHHRAGPPDRVARIALGEALDDGQRRAQGPVAQRGRGASAQAVECRELAVAEDRPDLAEGECAVHAGEAEPHRPAVARRLGGGWCHLPDGSTGRPDGPPGGPPVAGPVNEGVGRASGAMGGGLARARVSAVSKILPAAEAARVRPARPS